jgi:hypothetical protein
MKAWKTAGLVGIASLAALALSSAGAFAATPHPAVAKPTANKRIEEFGGMMTGGTSTYSFNPTVQVTITSDDPSLILPMNVAPTFYFENGMEPSFTPTAGTLGAGTFNPMGTKAAGAVYDAAASNPAQGEYVYTVSLPTSLTTGQASPYMWVFSNYEWYTQPTAGTPSQQSGVYSTLEDLVQALPEFPLALLAPAAVLGAWYLQRRRRMAKSV